MHARTDRRSSCSAEICFAGAPSCVCFCFIQGSPLRFNRFMRAIVFLLITSALHASSQRAQRSQRNIIWFLRQPEFLPAVLQFLARPALVKDEQRRTQLSCLRSCF